MRRTTSSVFRPLLTFFTVCAICIIFDSSQFQKCQKIAIVTIITNSTPVTDYQVALDSVKCYAQTQNYEFLVLIDSDYSQFCHQTHKFFLRHCVVAQILPRYDAILFLDADHGVVNPKVRIEKFMDPAVDLTFYDRFFDWEVMAGSYIVANTLFSRHFLRYWSDFESKMPRVKHGSDNAALHLILAEQLFSANYPDEVELCREAYYKAQNTEEIGTYIACIRHIFGDRTDFGKVRIMKKGTGWSRDDWLTSGMWNAERDFILHGWKTKNGQLPPNGTFGPIPMNYAHWYNPLAGPIDLQKCYPGNTTWAYNRRLLGDKRRIEEKLGEYARKIERNKMKSIGKLHQILERT
ncbi:unnamed protein product [Caenorhabditis sp. 36 PRJEB53466]|nr:unnamed protein product [Caenorhabditis sp. 36 PRJEB53466]